MDKNAGKNALLMALRPRELSQEEQRQLAKLHLEIKWCNRRIPALRLQLPSYWVPLNLEVCWDYYFRCREAAIQEDAPSEVAGLLASFEEKHPLEWSFCGWKNEFITLIMLGDKNAAQRWLKQHWQRKEKKITAAETYLGPKRSAASDAVLELEMLQGQDRLPPGLFKRLGFGGYATIVEWLNQNWATLATNKKGTALLNEAGRKLRSQHQDLAFTNSQLRDICAIYGRIETLHPSGKVPPYQLVLALVAERHGVSPRLVTTVRSELNKLRALRGLP